jgi:hypothetical protein
MSYRVFSVGECPVCLRDRRALASGRDDRLDLDAGRAPETGLLYTDIFRYFRLFWSFPTNAPPGARCRTSSATQVSPGAPYAACSASRTRCPDSPCVTPRSVGPARGSWRPSSRSSSPRKRPTSTCPRVAVLAPQPRALPRLLGGIGNLQRRPKFARSRVRTCPLGSSRVHFQALERTTKPWHPRQESDLRPSV